MSLSAGHEPGAGGLLVVTLLGRTLGLKDLGAARLTEQTPERTSVATSRSSTISCNEFVEQAHRTTTSPTGRSCLPSRTGAERVRDTRSFRVP